MIASPPMRPSSMAPVRLMKLGKRPVNPYRVHRKDTEGCPFGAQAPTIIRRHSFTNIIVALAGH